MREILFRGKSYNGECVEGAYYKQTEYYGDAFEAHYIISSSDELEDNMMIYDRVIPETVEQYTGLTDKNGKKIFEGDIVRAQDDLITSPFCDGVIGKIVYDECMFFIEPANPSDSLPMYNECAEYEVIGNIYDNPELLKGGTE